jgi:hypothetical protein
MSLSNLGIPKNTIGIIHTIEWCMSFVAWAKSLRDPPTPQEISQKFGVSRATGYRYHAAWQAMFGNDFKNTHGDAT